MPRLGRALLCALLGALAGATLLQESYTFETTATQGAAVSNGLQCTVNVVEHPPLLAGDGTLTLEADLRDVLSTYVGAAGFGRVRLPAETQASYARPFYLILGPTGDADAVYDPDDDVSVVAIKKSVVGMLLATLARPALDFLNSPLDPAYRRLSPGAAPAASLDGHSSGAAPGEDGAPSVPSEPVVAWQADEADTSGYFRGSYSAEVVDVVGAATPRRLLRVTRDVSHKRYYRTLADLIGGGGDSSDAAAGSSLGTSLGTGAPPTPPSSATESDGRERASLLHTAEMLLVPQSRRLAHGGRPAVLAIRGGRLLLGSLEAAHHTAAHVFHAGEPADQKSEPRGRHEGPVVSDVTTVVNSTLKLRSSKPARFVCTRAYAQAHGGEDAVLGAGWCVSIVPKEDESVLGPLGVAHEPGTDELASDGPRDPGVTHTFRGPQLLESALLGEPGSQQQQQLGLAARRRLLEAPASPSGHLIREPLLVDAAQLAAAEARLTGWRQVGGHTSLGFGRRLMEEARGPEAATDFAARQLAAGASDGLGSPLGLLFQALTCFPPEMHDDSVSRPSALEVNLLPCLSQLGNLTQAHPFAIVAIQALMLADPCEAASLPSAGSAMLASALVGGAPLVPSPCTGAGVDSPYAEARLSDRMVAILVGALASSMHTGAAQEVLTHILRHPDAYRYVTVLEHALNSAIFVSAPSSGFLQALLSVIKGLDELDTSAALATDDEPALLHQSQLKATAVLITAGVISNARKGALHPGAAASSLSVQSAESSLVSFLYRQYGRVSALAEARRKQEEVVGEMVVSLWHMVPERDKIRWRAVSRNQPIRDAERIWVTMGLTLAQRVAWDAQAMASWRDYIMMELSAKPTLLADMRVSIVAQLNEALLEGQVTHTLEAAAASLPQELAGDRRRLHELLQGPSGHHTRIASNRTHHFNARRLAEAALLDVAYDFDEWRSSLSTSSVILRAFGNLGSPEHLPLVLNYTSHVDPAVRDSAI